MAKELEAGILRPSSRSGATMGERAFKGVGDLIKLLPTGTVFLFQFLSPLLTNAQLLTQLAPRRPSQARPVPRRPGGWARAPPPVRAGGALLDNNTASCFYPALLVEEKTLVTVLPPVIGAVAGVVFMLFPNNRHGIGYPPNGTAAAK
ncbi:protein DMP2-like [Zingiber officinale]|uniref:Uncharacterized protein n=1 Tax=Zingiber officinale TaxID=94328 RepID=A0A8J5C9Z8_ZINOF|nr:protein DMP2-like [Zingiber officinale]KAG6470602.1 hypothetical protein ZIOFF_071676 [Zingiber officinale]